MSEALAHTVAVQRAYEDVMAIIVNIHEAKTHLSQLLQRVRALVQCDGNVFAF